MTASACWTERSVQSDSLCVSKTCMWQACMWQTCKPTQQKPFFSFADASGWGWRKRGTIKLCIRHNCKAAFFGENLEKKDESETVGSSKRQLGPVGQSIVVYVRAQDMLVCPLLASIIGIQLVAVRCVLSVCVHCTPELLTDITPDSSWTHNKSVPPFPSVCFSIYILLFLCFFMSWPLNGPYR